MSIKSYTGKECCQLLERNGWRLKRINGSHHIYGKPGERALIVVPVHGNQSLKPGLQRAILKLGIGLGGAMLGGIALGRYLPNSWLFRKLTLSASTSADEGYISSTNEARDLVGARGVTATVLRPSGQARFDDRLVDVVSDGDMIDEGSPIEVVAVNGSRVEVRRRT